MAISSACTLRTRHLGILPISVLVAFLDESFLCDAHVRM